MPSPPPNHRTATQAISTESHIVEAPMINGVRVSPLPRRLPLLTNQSAQKGKRDAQRLQRAGAGRDHRRIGRRKRPSRAR